MEAAIFGLVGVALGAVLTALLTMAKEWCFQSKKTQKDAEYLAIQVSCALDRYVADCAAVVGDKGIGDWYNDDCEFQVNTPVFETDSFDVEWKALPGKLMYEVLHFPYRAKLVDGHLADVFHFAAPPDWDDCLEERQYQYAKLGIAASGLVEKLRDYAGLTIRSSDDEWDPVAFMKDEMTTIETRRKKQASQSESSLR
jgi:hypothetical protein